VNFRCYNKIALAEQLLESKLGEEKDVAVQLLHKNIK